MKITQFSHFLMWSNDTPYLFTIMRYIIIISAIIMMGACSNDKILKDKLEALYSTPVVFPNSGMLHIDNAANNNNQEKTPSSKYKLLVFSGPDECSICAVNKMSEWNALLNLEKEGFINMIFIFNPLTEEKDDVIAAYHTSGLEHSIELDTCGIFLQKNSQIPEAKAFHTLLLDTDNKVILVGDPIHNKKIKKLFYERIGANRMD